MLDEYSGYGDSIDFSVLIKNELICDISVSGNSVEYKPYVSDFELLPFGTKHAGITREDVAGYLESRCLPSTRRNLKYCLKVRNVPIYTYYDIISSTHGLLTCDYEWIRMKGEHITYEDIAVRE